MGWDLGSRGPTVAIRRRVIARDGCCRVCGSTVTLEVHHVVPLVEGGSSRMDNLVLLCRACHGAR